MTVENFEQQSNDSDENSKTQAFEKLGIQKENLTNKGQIKNIWKLSFKERITLEGIMLGPAFIVLAVLFTTSNFLLTLFVFHLFLIGIPLMYLNRRGLKTEWKWVLFQEMMQKAARIKHSVKLVALPVILCLISYIGFRNIHKGFNIEALRVPSFSESVTTLLLGFEFVILNPILEEIFWRVFCDSFLGQGKTFLQRLDLGFHFAVYHWFVIYFICQDALLSSVGFLFIWFLGYVLTITKQKAGLITAMLIHMGIDLSAALVVLDMKSRYLPFF